MKTSSVIIRILLITSLVVGAAYMQGSNKSWAQIVGSKVNQQATTTQQEQKKQAAAQTAFLERTTPRRPMKVVRLPWVKKNRHHRQSATDNFDEYSITSEASTISTGSVDSRESIDTIQKEEAYIRSEQSTINMIYENISDARARIEELQAQRGEDQQSIQSGGINATTFPGINETFKVINEADSAHTVAITANGTSSMHIIFAFKGIPQEVTQQLQADFTQMITQLKQQHESKESKEG